jgi:hypothetical protein
VFFSFCPAGSATRSPAPSVVHIKDDSTTFGTVPMAVVIAGGVTVLIVVVATVLVMKSRRRRANKM